MADVLERFMSKVVWNGDEDECWTWQARTDRGYGYFWHEGHQRPAHRVAYELFVGPIPEGLEIDHTCHNDSGCSGGVTCPHRACVNPAHLEAVSGGENTRRGRSPEIAASRMATKTHCPHGHPYSGENLYLDPRGKRQCRRCRSERQHARLQSVASGPPPMLRGR